MMIVNPVPEPSPVRLLIVDDEPVVLEVTRDYLNTFASFQTEGVESGEQALSLLETGSYDLIVSDYEMEPMSGIDLLRILRQRGDTTPFIIFTGKGREEVVIEAFENGADAYVTKGGEIRAQFSDLMQKIRTLVEKRRAQTALEEIEGVFRGIFMNSPIAIELFDANGTLVSSNPACLELFGARSLQDLQGLSLSEYPWFSPAGREALIRGEAVEFRVEFSFDDLRDHHLPGITREGRRHLDIRITPMYLGNHALSGYLVQILDYTREAEAQEEIAEKNRFLECLLETIPIPVYSQDLQGRFVLCNSAFETFIGRDKAQILGRTVQESVSIPVPPIIREKDRELIRTREVQIFEATVPDQGGVMHDVLFHKASMSDQKGALTGIIGIMLDITDRNAVQQTLAENEAYIRTVLENLPLGVAVSSLSASEGVWYYNRNFLKYYRVSEASLWKFENFWEAAYPDPVQRTGIRTRILADIASGDPSRMYWEDIPLSRDGEETTYISAMNIPLSERGLMISTVWDVTKRKLTEKELKDTNALLEGMLNGIPDIIGIQNPDHTMVRYNQAGYDLLGLTPEEVSGKPCYSFIGRNTPCQQCATVRAVEKKEIVSLERYVSELGRYYLCRSNPILDETGEIRFIVEHLIDITSQKQLEEALHQTNQKIRLLTGLTRHDILNLINAIYLYHHFALDTGEMEKIQDFINRADEAAKRIEATIGFTREYEEFGIASSRWEEVYRIIESAKREIDFGTIRVENGVPPSLEVYADPIIRKVFSTLLENAVRHGDTLSRIRFTTEEMDDGLTIRCEDDGRGIPYEEKTCIFNQGYGNNTGVGLFLAKEILSITGLSIRENGIPGEGARFEITIPGGKWRI